MPKKKYIFINLFTGIGGFYTALQRVGGECVFYCGVNMTTIINH